MMPIDIDGNNAGFKLALEGAKEHAKEFTEELRKEMGASWGGVGRGLVGGIGAMLGFETVRRFIESTFQTANALKDTSEEFDVSVESVQKWEKAMGRAGLASRTF